MMFVKFAVKRFIAGKMVGYAECVGGWFVVTALMQKETALNVKG
jgi:hypothetical protein